MTQETESPDIPGGLKLPLSLARVPCPVGQDASDPSAHPMFASTVLRRIAQNR
jgi:hypothetical protein